MISELLGLVHALKDFLCCRALRKRGAGEKDQAVPFVALLAYVVKSLSGADDLEVCSTHSKQEISINKYL